MCTHNSRTAKSVVFPLNMHLSRSYDMGLTPRVGGDMCLTTYEGVKAKCSDKFTLVQKKKIAQLIPSSRASATATAFSSSTLLGTRWRGSHESIVTRQCLLQQRRTRRAINRSLSFCHRFVFHQCVALQPMGSQISFTGSETGLKTHFHIACPPIEIEM